MKKRCYSIVLVIFIISIVFGNYYKAFASADHFPCPQELRPRVEFWKKIYSQYTTEQGLMHDSENLEVIYAVLDFKDILGKRKTTRKRIKDNRKKYKKIIDSIIKKNGTNLSNEEEMIFNLFKDKSMARLKKARCSIRFQLGQKDRFIHGVKNSYRYLDHIKEIVNKFGVPEELMYLPHVESSFNYKAFSKFGAAGIWQFTRSTGCRYLKINYVYDERLDPLKATKAAIQHLLDNYKELKSWPLAITAYNHGVGGMKRAVKNLGTTDILEIIDNYKGKTFGFASRNFYCEFLAASEIAHDYKKYFGELTVKSPLRYQTYKFKDKVLLKDMVKYTNLDREIIQRYNPSIRKPGLLSHRYLPKGFVLNLPEDGDYKLDDFFKIYKPSKPVTIASAKVKAVRKRPMSSDRPKKQLEKNNKKAETINLGPAEIRLTEEEYLKEYALVKVKGQYAWLRVGIDETIGHYAEWAGIRASEIRRLNNMYRYSSHVKIGKVIKIRLNNVDRLDFENARIDYHKGIEEDFFDNYQIEDVYEYDIRKGDNLWFLCEKELDVPQWLIRRYNNHVDFNKLMPGTTILVPNIVEGTEQS